MICDELRCPNAGHTEASERRRAKMARQLGSYIVIDRDAGGRRDYLDGKPIHCGTTLELQAVDYAEDDFGSYSVTVDRWTTVRYELTWKPDGKRKIVLFKYVDGHQFVTEWNATMRFRWPRGPLPEWAGGGA